MPKKRHDEQRPPPKPHPWTLKDKAWVALLVLIVVVPMAWALMVTGEFSPMSHDLMNDLRGQMIDLELANPNLLGWSVEERDGVLELELTVSGEATEEDIERWGVYFLGTANSTVGSLTDYEYELTVRRHEESSAD